jgi:hypothetical protein
MSNLLKEDFFLSREFNIQDLDPFLESRKPIYFFTKARQSFLAE